MPQTFNTKLASVCFRFIKLLGCTATPDTVRQTIERHPHFPSLLSLSDTLDIYDVANVAYKVNKKDLDQLATPFIAYMYIQGVGYDFAIVTSLTAQSVSYVYGRSTSKTISKEVFLKDFNEVVMLAEASEDSMEENYTDNLRKQNNKLIGIISWSFFAAVFIVLLVMADLVPGQVLSFISIAGLKFFGLSISILLLLFEIDKNNSFVKNLCKSGAQFHCDAVLNSKASRIAGISWSEIGFLYFACTTVWLLTPALSYQIKFYGLGIANLLAVPYVVFSIGYQWKIVKQWCPLCLSAQAVLLGELAWSVINHAVHTWYPEWSTGLILWVSVSLILPPIVWFGLKETFKKAHDFKLYQSAYLRQLHNPDVFTALLKQQKKAPDIAKDLGIGLGRPDAKFSIVKVCNPFCGPCADAHPLLDDILSDNNAVNVKILFNIVSTSQQDKTNKVAKHLLTVAAENNEDKTKEALDGWYLSEKKEYSDFAARFPVQADDSTPMDKQIEDMREWCRLADISYTPTIFVNGYRMPENYTLEDLKMILN